MKKTLILLLSIMNVFALTSSAQPILEAQPIDPIRLPASAVCDVIANLFIEKINPSEIMYGVVAEECKDNFNYTIPFFVNYCTGGGASQTVTAQLYLENDLLSSEYIGVLPGGGSFSGNFGAINKAEGHYEFEIKFIITTTYYTSAGFTSWTTYQSIFLPFDIIHSNGTGYYEVFYWSTDIGSTDQILLQCIGDAPRICCGGGRYDFKYIESFTVTETETTTGDVSISFGGSLSGTVEKVGEIGSTPFNIPLGLGLSGSYTVSKSIAEEIKQGFGVELLYRLKPSSANCIGPGLSLQRQKLVRERFVPNCEGIEISIEREEQWVPLRLVPMECDYGPPPSNCEQINPENIQKIRNLVSTDCSWSLFVTIENQENLDIAWSGPNGFESFDWELDNLPLGTYQYRIWNECCDERTGTVTLCDEMETGPWYPGPGEREYCQILTCHDGKLQITNIENIECQVEECVLPDLIENSMVNGKCTESHYYQGEYLGGLVLSEPVTNITYEGTAKMCHKVVTCGEEIIEEANEFATFGQNWNYDHSTRTCSRTVFCFNEEIQGQFDTQPAIVTEVFNPNTGQCEYEILCDGIPQYTPPSFPIMNGPWTWTEWGGCSKQVQCDINSGIMNINGNESFGNWNFNDNTNTCEQNVYCNNDLVFGVNNTVMSSFYNWSFNSSTNLCESAVSCANLPLPGVNNTETPNSIGTWNWVTTNPLEQQCVRQVFCGQTNELIYDYTTPDFVVTGNTCPGSPQVNQAQVWCGGVNTGILTCFKGAPPEVEYLGGGTGSLIFSEVTISPNPFKNIISIAGIPYDSEGYFYQIVTLQGQIKKKGSLTSNTIEASELVSGVYFIRILDFGGNDIYSQRIVKL